MDYTEYYDNYYLMHHGVKGMKWGVRKQRSAGNSKYRRKKYRDPDYIYAHQKRKVSEMSNNDLDKALNRLRKESEYLQRTNKPSATLKWGKRIVGTVATAIAVRELTALANKGVNKLKNTNMEDIFKAANDIYHSIPHSPRVNVRF